MIRIQFTAAREMTGGHLTGDTVTLSFSAAELTPGREVKRSAQIAIGGRRETLLMNTTRTWSVSSGPLEASTIDTMQEFLASVEGGESFTFEPWRYETGPSLDFDFLTPRLRIAEAVPCVLDTESWQLQRIADSANGTGGADDTYQVSFTVREIP